MENPSEPVSDLELLLQGLSPEARPGRFVFVSVEPGQSLEEMCHAWIREPEGPGAVVREEDAQSLGLGYGPVFAWITLAVVSDLESVGLTAAVSGALAEAGISANLLAGMHHDHVLVPFEDLETALATLQDLSKSHNSQQDG